ncbi:MAG: WD40/YVTN/BNR-like repeat-containing protein [bacterium]
MATNGKTIAAFSLTALAIANWAAAQMLTNGGWPHRPKTADTNLPTNLNSNGIEEIVLHRGELWIGTDKGLARSRDGGKIFVTYTTQNGLPRGGVSALAVTDSIILVATDFDSLTKTDAGLQPTGGGMSYSTDDGRTWTYVRQFGPSPVQNVTYDIALHKNAIWRASWGGGLQRSADLGQTWEVVAPDTFFFEPLANLNHRAFSIINADGVLWHGTAGGINKSLDGGATWTNFSHQNQAQSISGNWAVAIAHQKWRGREYIWAAPVRP